MTFKAPFEVTFSRDDYVHALVAFFDVEFNYSHKPISFSTGPADKYTHWKQTVFYLKDILTVKAGEKLSGTLSCTPNPKNHRDLDIVIKYDFDGECMSAHHEQFYRLR